MFTTKKTTIVSKILNKDVLGKASEALEKAGEALEDAFKDFDKHFEGTTTESRLETDKMVVDVSDTQLVVKGELSSITLNGKIIWSQK
jgi:hypothetical protein